MADLSRLIKPRMTFEEYDDAVEKICEKFEGIPAVFPNKIEFLKYIKRDPWQYVDIAIYILEEAVPETKEQEDVEKDMKAWIRGLVELVYEENEGKNEDTEQIRDPD